MSTLKALEATAPYTSGAGRIQWDRPSVQIHPVRRHIVAPTLGTGPWGTQGCRAPQAITWQALKLFRLKNVG